MHLHENKSCFICSDGPNSSDSMVSLDNNTATTPPVSISILSSCFLCLFAKESSFGVLNMEKAYFIKWILEARFDWGGVLGL